MSGIDFDRLVKEEFGSMCQTFNLLIEKIDDGEVALIAKSFLILIWLEREGISIKYVKLGLPNYNIIDLGRFIAQRRRWTIDNLKQLQENPEARLRQECSIFAFNLQKYAVDILQGESNWIKEITHNPSPLSEITSKSLIAAIERSEKRRSA